MQNPSGDVEECYGDSCNGTAYWEWDATYHKYAKGMLRPDGQPGFNTPTGRIELWWPFGFDHWGVDPLPYHVEPPESPLSTPETFKEFPIILSGGGRSFEFFHSEHRQLPTMPRVPSRPAHHGEPRGLPEVRREGRRVDLGGEQPRRPLQAEGQGDHRGHPGPRRMPSTAGGSPSRTAPSRTSTAPTSRTSTT